MKTNITRDEVLETLREVIVAHNPTITRTQLLNESTRLVQDLSLDSLDIIEVWLELESRLDIEIPDSQLENENFASEVTLGHVVDEVLKLAQPSSGAQ